MVSIGRVLWAVLKMDGPRWLAETTEQAHDEAHRHKEKERERGRKERDASRAHTLRCVHVGRWAETICYVYVDLLIWRRMLWSGDEPPDLCVDGCVFSASPELQRRVSTGLSTY